MRGRAKGNGERRGMGVNDKGCMIRATSSVKASGRTKGPGEKAGAGGRGGPAGSK